MRRTSPYAQNQTQGRSGLIATRLLRFFSMLPPLSKHFDSPVKQEDGEKKAEIQHFKSRQQRWSPLPSVDLANTKRVECCK